MVSNSAVKNNKLTLTFFSERDRFQNFYRLVSYVRISSKKSVDITIQQMIKFDVLSASFIFLLTLFYSFKARYKKEIYSFLIGQNLPGIANLSQKTFKDTSKYVFPFQSEPFLEESQFYFDTNFIEYDLTNFYENQVIKLKKKEAFPKENLIFNGKTLKNFSHVKHNNHFDKNGKFVPSIYHQTKSFNRNQIKTTLYNTNLSSSYHLSFQSFAAKNFALSTIKRLEKEGTYFKLSELPLKCDFYFGVFQKKDITPQLTHVRESIFKFPLKEDSGAFDIVATGDSLQNKIGNKSLSFCDAKTKFSEGKQLFLTKTKNINWGRLCKQNKITTETLFEKSQKKWFCLDQNKSLQTQWFSLYKNNLSNKYSRSLRDQKNCEKLKTQPLLLDKLFSIFYNVNNLPKSHALHSHTMHSPFEEWRGEHSFSNLNNKETLTSTNWWNFIFNGDFSLNSNFIIENTDFPFFQWDKSLSFCDVKTKFSKEKPFFLKQKQETALDFPDAKMHFGKENKRKTIFFFKKLESDRKWKKTNYHNYLQLDEFPSKLSSILPLEILTNQFFTKKTYTLVGNVTKTKREILDSSKKTKPLVIKQKFLLRESKSLLHFYELDFTKEKDSSLQDKSTASASLTSSENSTIKNLNSEFRQHEKVDNSSLKKGFLDAKMHFAPNGGSKEDLIFAEQKLREKALFLQKNINTNQANNDLNDKFSLTKQNFIEENQSKTFHSFPKSFKLRLLRNEIKAIFSSSQKNSYFMEKEEKTFNLLSTKLLTSLDDILLSNFKLLQGEDPVSQSGSLDTLFEFLPQKNDFTDRKVLQSINDKILFHKNPVEQNTEETLFLTQENTDLVKFNDKFKNKENFKLRYAEKFTQLLQDFWSKKEDISRKNGSDFLTENLVFDVFSETKNKEQKLKKDFIEKRKENWLTFFIKYLSTQPRLMSGYQFPDLNTKEIDKLIKYLNFKKILVNKTHLLREISFFINNFGKNKTSRFQNPMWSIYSQILKKEIYQQHPIDAYLPNNYIETLPQSKYISLQKNLFFDEKVGGKPLSGVGLVPLSQSMHQVNCGGATMASGNCAEGTMVAKPQSFFESMDQRSIVAKPPISLEKGNSYLKPLKFISKSLRLENNTEKQSFFVYQIPALLKTPSIWNPRLQKLQIAKTINKSKDIPSSIDFTKNVLSSTNFLTDRKLHFFAIGNQVEKEQENCFIQRPFSGSLFGLSYNKTNLNLQDEFLCKNNSQNQDLPNTKKLFGKENVVFAQQKLREQDKNLNLIKKDFSILPLLSKVTVKENSFFENQLSFTPIMSSLHAGSNFVFSEENSKDNLEKRNKASKTTPETSSGGRGLLPYARKDSSKIYKIYPKSFKSITGIKFYSFFDLSAFDSLRAVNLQIKTNAFLNNYPSTYETFTDLTQNNSKFDQLAFTEKILKDSKLNIKRKQLSDKCDKQINTLQLVLPFLETDTFTTTWTKWLSSRYKKPAISYRFQKKVFYLPSNKKVDFFLEQKNRYQKNKWGKIEQQENRSQKGERDEDSLTNFSEQVYLPLTIKRSIHFPNKSKILLSKNSKFSFFTTEPLFLQGQKKESKLLASNLENQILNTTTCEQNVESQNKPKKTIQVVEYLTEQNVTPDPKMHFGKENAVHFSKKNEKHQQNDLFLKNFAKQNLVSALLRLKKSNLSSANLQKNDDILGVHFVKPRFSEGFPEKNLVFAKQKLRKSILPQKKLSFLPKTVWQEQDRIDLKLPAKAVSQIPFGRSENQVLRTPERGGAKMDFGKEISFWKNRKKNNFDFFILDEKEDSVVQIPPLSYFLSDTLQKEETSLSHLKRLDTNCDRLGWQFDQWYPFLYKKYAYSPPSQSILSEEFLNSFFKNKIRKRNTIYKYSKQFPILKFHYVKSKGDSPQSLLRKAKGLKDLLPKISTLQNQNVQDEVFSHFTKQNIRQKSETLSTFRRAYSVSHLQNKQSFSNLLFPKRKRIDLCWEPITLRSWMIITQYCYAFFLVQSALYVYHKHMKKVLLSFAPLLSGRGILSGIPSFGEKLQDFLGGSTIDKNVLLFEKVSKRFQDIVAIDNKLPQLSEIVWFLRNFGRTANVNKIQGVLFVGPPGTGKTLLVQAIAGEAEVPILVLSGSSFADGKKDKKSGQLLKRVFQRARILAPSILFIDEIDTLGESRSHFAQDDRDQKNESSRIIESISQTEGKIQGKISFSQNRKNQSVKQVGLLTQFLVEMDGLARQQKSSSFLNNKITFGKPGGIVVIGSTNRPKVLDPALTRPGRFDQVFYLSNPGKQKRIEILKIYAKNIGVSPSLPWDYLGDRTLGFSAADLSAIINKSTIQGILSHTIHTIQSIEDGIESLPKLSQNHNKSFILEKNDLSTSFLFLESQQLNNENTILCKSILNSLSICVKHLNLQNKYKNFNFSTDQSKSDQNFISKFSHKKTTSTKLVDLKKYKDSPDAKMDFGKESWFLQSKKLKPLQQSFGNINLQENKRRFQFDDSLSFYTDNFIFTKQNLRIGIPFSGRLPFYQAGKVMTQILLSQDPITLIATLNPKQELFFLNMFKESTHVKEVTNCDQFETRLISGYAGKAAETLLVSGLQFSKNNKTAVTWQSTLGVEEWKLTNSLAYSMIFKYYFYSQRVNIQKENLIALSQNSNEILETENFQVLQNIFFKEELKFSQEKHYPELSEGKNDILNTIAENKSFLNPIIWISNLYQEYEITKIFGHIEENNWYQVYLPPLVKDEQNREWVPLDQYYFGRENLIELIWNTSKNKSLNWSDVSQLDSDFIYQGLVIYHFNKALSLLDKNRELLDLFANLLISFRIIRRHEILKIFYYFKYYNLSFAALNFDEVKI